MTPKFTDEQQESLSLMGAVGQDLGKSLTGWFWLWVQSSGARGRAAGGWAGGPLQSRVSSCAFTLASWASPQHDCLQVVGLLMLWLKASCDPGRSYMAFLPNLGSPLVSFLPYSIGYCESHNCTDIRGGDIDPTSWWKECQGQMLEEQVGRERLSQPSLENRICPSCCGRNRFASLCFFEAISS